MSMSQKVERPLRLVALAAAIALPVSAAAGDPPLALVAKIPLGTVAGRIDHMAFDPQRRLLLVAELGNDSLGVVDIAAGRVRRRIAGLAEPQGVGYEPAGDIIYVANARDGSVRLFRAEDYAAAGRIELGGDADNVRIDTAHRRVLVGYGSGGLAAIDADSRARTGTIRLTAHPESFQLDETGARAFVNVPQARTIEIVDLAQGRAAGTLPTAGYRANFPMALDRDRHRLIVAFRSPPRLLALATADGRVVGGADTCGDADDVFVDAKRRRVYVSCGEGAVDVLDAADYRRLGRAATAPGARTSLFVPELDRLFVAVRAAGPEPAAIWVLRPLP